MDFDNFYAAAIARGFDDLEVNGDNVFVLTGHGVVKTFDDISDLREEIVGWPVQEEA